MRSQHRFPMYGAIAAVLLLGGAAAAPAAADSAASPIGPRQYFTGQVNGVSDRARIQVVCPVVGDGRTGHPVAGQSVAVLPAITTNVNTVGFTGESADQIMVDFGTVSITRPVVLTSYGTRAEIPKTLDLPCTGTGQVAFVPTPRSETSRPASVAVTYESVGG